MKQGNQQDKGLNLLTNHKELTKMLLNNGDIYNKFEKIKKNMQLVNEILLDEIMDTEEKLDIFDKLSEPIEIEQDKNTESNIKSTKVNFLEFKKLIVTFFASNDAYNIQYKALVEKIIENHFNFIIKVNEFKSNFKGVNKFGDRIEKWRSIRFPNFYFLADSDKLIDKEIYNKIKGNQSSNIDNSKEYQIFIDIDNTLILKNGFTGLFQNSDSFIIENKDNFKKSLEFIALNHINYIKNISSKKELSDEAILLNKKAIENAQKRLISIKEMRSIIEKGGQINSKQLQNIIFASFNSELLDKIKCFKQKDIVISSTALSSFHKLKEEDYKFTEKDYIYNFIMSLYKETNFNTLKIPLYIKEKVFYFTIEGQSVENAISNNSKEINITKEGVGIDKFGLENNLGGFFTLLGSQNIKENNVIAYDNDLGKFINNNKDNEITNLIENTQFAVCEHTLFNGYYNSNEQEAPLTLDDIRSKKGIDSLLLEAKEAKINILDCSGPDLIDKYSKSSEFVLERVKNGCACNNDDFFKKFSIESLKLFENFNKISEFKEDDKIQDAAVKYYTLLSSFSYYLKSKQYNKSELEEKIDLFKTMEKFNFDFSKINKLEKLLDDNTVSILKKELQSNFNELTKGNGSNNEFNIITNLVAKFLEPNIQNEPKKDQKQNIKKQKKQIFLEQEKLFTIDIPDTFLQKNDNLNNQSGQNGTIKNQNQTNVPVAINTVQDQEVKNKIEPTFCQKFVDFFREIFSGCCNDSNVERE
jgi:hypothetical protein